MNTPASFSVDTGSWRVSGLVNGRENLEECREEALEVGIGVAVGLIERKDTAQLQSPSSSTGP
jgi:hypothetical protein